MLKLALLLNLSLLTSAYLNEFAAVSDVAGKCKVTARVSKQVSECGEREQTTRCSTDKHGVVLHK
jgi:hypothetical protein